MSEKATRIGQVFLPFEKDDQQSSKVDAKNKVRTLDEINK